MFINITILVLSFSSLFSQQKFGSDSTLDIITWNIQDFPKHESTIEEVRNIINKIDVDIIAFQEIADSLAFYELANSLDNYKGFVKIDYQIGLAYLYKNEIIKVDSIYQMFTDYEHWNNFPRAPLFMHFKFQDQDFIIINNHLKCCGDGELRNTKYDEENRRRQAMGMLLSHSNQNFYDKNHIILGDLNDDILDPLEHNAFIGILNNPDKYIFADYEIARGSQDFWSYPSYPSHLDHIIISKTLFDDFNNNDSETNTLIFDDFYQNGFEEYDEKISDHRPVAMKLKLNEINTNVKNHESIIFENNIIKQNEIISNIVIYNTLGQIIHSSTPNQNYFNLSFLPTGIYFININFNNSHKVNIY